MRWTFLTPSNSAGSCSKRSLELVLPISKRAPGRLSPSATNMSLPDLDPNSSLHLRKAAMPPKLILQNLEIAFGTKKILESVNLELNPQTLLLFSAPNGSGKSSLLRCIAGMYSYKGAITINGYKAGSIAAKKFLGYVPDEPALYEDLTLEEHAVFVARVYGVKVERIIDWLERFGLEQNFKEFPIAHSQGMRQKLGLALALGIGLPIILLDEPYNGLDEQAQNVLTDGLIDHVQAGGIVMLSAHQADIRQRLGLLEFSQIYTIHNKQLERQVKP